MSDNEDPDYKPDSSLASINLGLGDIIKIIAKSNNELNDKIFYISYIDKNKLKLDNDTQNIIINIDENNELTEKSIEEIEILSKPEFKGYAKQNNLNINTWISVQFEGELPITINGIITDQENDLIEIKTYPEEEYIYIDFAYKGIPEDLPIKSITIIDNPLKKQDLDIPADEFGKNVIDEKDDTFINKQEFEKDLDAVIIPNEFIEFGDDLDEIKVLVDVEKSEQRYDIDKQLNDLLDEMLSIIPNSERTTKVLNNIHKQIERFNELRELFSKKDDSNNYNIKDAITEDYKPLIDIIKQFNTNIKWITPVITNKKIFYEEENDILEDDSAYIVENIYNSLNEYYNELEKIKSNSSVESINKYKEILSNIAEFNAMYINNNQEVFYNAQVKNYINTLVNNYDNIMSNTFNKNKLRPYFFYNQVLNYPDTNLERVFENNKKRNNRTYFNYDNIDLNSFIINNETIYKYSNMDNLNTNIYNKSNYSYNYKFFKSHNNYLKKNYVQIFLDSFNTKFDNTNVLKNNVHFLLDNNLYKNFTEYQPDQKILEQDNNLNDLLNSILPNTSSLIDKFKSNGVNISQFLYNLQPNNSNIYNIEYNNYNKIITNIKNNIDNYKKTFITNKETFSNLISKKNKEIIDKLNISKKFVSLFKKLNSKVKNDFFQYYNIKKSNDTSDDDSKKKSQDKQVLLNEYNLYQDEEIFKMTNTIDFNNTLFNSFYQSLLELITTNQIEQFMDIKNKNIEEIKKNASDTCGKFILSKKYIELDELENDNNKIIYFDKKLDKTDYNILEKLKEKRKTMNQEDFSIFLENKLLEDNIVLDVKREVDAILNNKKQIIDGDYAILISNKDSTSDNITDKVYVRQNNKWIYDVNVDPKIFFLTNKLFCNLQDKCVELKDKCASYDDFNTTIENQTINNIVDQTSVAFEKSIQETKEYIDKQLNNSLSFLEKKNEYNKINYLKYNQNIQKISQTYVENEYQQSPYENLKNKILYYNDFVKKQDYIIKFTNLFTREAINDEDKNWLYCNKTNKKLLPTFLKKLAISYYNNDYLYVLDEIVAERGTLSDDGNTWVDKHSGYIIKMIEFDTDEGYNEQGFKLQTRDVMEKEYTITQTNIKYTSESSQLIYKVISSISSFIGLNLETFYDFIINNVNDLLKITIPSKENYEKTQKRNKELGKKELADYNTLYNSTLIISTMVFIVIAIQTSIPSLKSKKTFPGCIKSFTGYPLNGNVDKSSITYIACVVNNIKTNIIPWNSILKTSQSSLIKKMETIIDNHVLKSKEILELFNKKTEYLSYNKDDVIPDELDISKWTSFLPPLTKIEISQESLQPVHSEFKNIILDNIRKGKIINSYYDILYKINNFSFGIIKSIQNTLNKHTTLLATNNGEPFLENACCNNIINAIEFFKKEDSNIDLYNNNSKLLETFIETIVTLEKSPILYHPFNTKIKSYEMLNTYNETIIYEYFIKKCKFDSIIPISDDIKAICMNKPADYNINDNIEKKIQILKNNGNNYSIDSLEELMQIINSKNLFKITFDESNDSLKKLFNTLTSINELINNDSTIENLFNKKIIEKFIEIIEKLSGPSGDKITDDGKTTLMREFKNLLIKDTELNKIRTYEYVERNANLNKKEINNFKKCLNNFLVFDNINFQNIQYFYKNSIHNLIQIFPNIIINNLVIEQSNLIPDYWKLSPKHNEDLYNIANNYYKNLYKYFDSKKLHIILKHFQDKCLLLEKIIKNTNYYDVDYSEKQNNNIFDKEFTILLFENYLYRILTYLTDIYNDPSLLIQLNEVDDEKLYNETEMSDDKNVDDFEIEGGVSKGELDIQNTGAIEYSSFVDEEKKVIENNTANIIFTFINLVCDNKTLININYQTIIRKVGYAKDKEKTTIVNFLKELTAENREIEDVLKNNKLERWSVGLQKGLTQYDPNFYDSEREKLELQLLTEAKLQKVDEVTKMNTEIYEYDLEYQDKIDKEVDQEYNLSNIPDDNNNDYDEFDDPDYLNYEGDYE